MTIYVYRHGQIVPKDETRYVGCSSGPYVISDEMPPTEQVDGVFYTSKAKFRAKGRELGLIEVGTSKFPAKVRSTDLPATKQERRQVIKDAVEKYRAGWR